LKKTQKNIKSISLPFELPAEEVAAAAADVVSEDVPTYKNIVCMSRL